MLLRLLGPATFSTSRPLPKLLIYTRIRLPTPATHSGTCSLFSLRFAIFPPYWSTRVTLTRSLDYLLMQSALIALDQCILSVDPFATPAHLDGPPSCSRTRSPMLSLNSFLSPSTLVLSRIAPLTSRRTLTFLSHFSVSLSFPLSLSLLSLSLSLSVQPCWLLAQSSLSNPDTDPSLILLSLCTDLSNHSLNFRRSGLLVQLLVLPLAWRFAALALAGSATGSPAATEALGGHGSDSFKSQTSLVTLVLVVRRDLAHPVHTARRTAGHSTVQRVRGQCLTCQGV